MKRLCEVCGVRAATGSCRLCGRLVCDECGRDGLCISCAETLCEVCGKRLSIATCAVCGRRVCEECSVQLDPVVRVCVECWKRGKRPERSPPPALVRLVEERGLRRS